jgi:hypothetical protein
MQLFDIAACLQQVLARHSVLWYIYSPMDTGRLRPYQITSFYQISHCRSTAIGDSPGTPCDSGPTGTVDRL